MKTYLTLIRTMAFAAGFFIVPEIALAQTVPLSVSNEFHYQGMLKKFDGTPMTGQVNLDFQILSLDGNCLLYEETLTEVDLTSTNGVFNVRVGSSVGSLKRSLQDPGLDMTTIFANRGQIFAPGAARCAAGYTPQNFESRLLRVAVQQGGVWRTITQDHVLSSVPSAIVAQSLQGYTVADLDSRYLPAWKIGTLVADKYCRTDGTKIICDRDMSSVTGPAGPKGDKGDKGDNGTAGAVGPAGPQGPAGPAGAPGVKGDRGIAGPAGPAGATGPAGPQGLPGAVGPKGDRGDVGPVGLIPGVAIYGSTNNIAALYSNNIRRVTIDNQGFVGIGTTSATTRLDVAGGLRLGLDSGMCVAGKSGTLRFNASKIEFCNGTAWTAFSAGELGPQGPQGPKGDKGDTGAPGPAGIAGAAGPAGAQGPKGDRGAAGPAGPAGIPGPQGDRGIAGPAGAQGPKGDRGDVGPVGLIPGVAIYGSTNNIAALYSNNVRRVTIDQRGFTGVGLTEPKVNLDVNGPIRAGSTGVRAGANCTVEGAMAYDATAHKPVYCSQSLKWTLIGSDSSPSDIGSVCTGAWMAGVEDLRGIWVVKPSDPRGKCCLYMGATTWFHSDNGISYVPYVTCN